MFQKDQNFSILFVILCVGVLLLCRESYAEPPSIVRIVVAPPVTIGTPITDPIALKVFAKGEEPLQYEWKLDGLGELEEPTDDSAVRYIPPRQIDGESAKATITVKVSDRNGQEASKSVIFTIILPPQPTPTPIPTPKPGMSTLTKTAIGIGAAATVGVGIYLLTRDDDNGDGDHANDGSSIQITSPVENSLVGWITNVHGIASGFNSDYYVTVSIQPYDDEWHPQSDKGTIDANGNWMVQYCYFGREGLDTGYNFRFRADLRNESGQVKASDTVEKVTRK